MNKVKYVFSIFMLGLAFCMFSSVNTSLAGSTKSADSIFSPVRNYNDLQQKLRSARNNNKPVLIEFYAAWCHACQQADQYIFSDPEIQRQLRSFEVLRVDLTNKNPDSTEIARRYKVYATPTFIFYDENGKKYKPKSLNSRTNRNTFLEALKELN